MNTSEIITSHLLHLWRENKLLDVAVLCKGKPVCCAHQVVLSAFSPVVMDRISSAAVVPSDGNDHLKMVELDELNSESVEAIVTYMYTGCINFMALDQRHIDNLLIDSQFLNMTHIVQVIKAYLSGHSETGGDSGSNSYQRQSSECADSTEQSNVSLTEQELSHGRSLSKSIDVSNSSSSGANGLFSSDDIANPSVGDNISESVMSALGDQADCENRTEGGDVISSSDGSNTQETVPLLRLRVRKRRMENSESSMNLRKRERNHRLDAREESPRKSVKVVYPKLPRASTGANSGLKGDTDASSLQDDFSTERRPSSVRGKRTSRGRKQEQATADTSVEEEEQEEEEGHEAEAINEEMEQTKTRKKRQVSKPVTVKISKRPATHQAAAKTEKPARTPIQPKYTDEQLEACVQDSGLYKCPECSKELELEALKQHVRRAHSGKQFKCEHCPKVFRDRYKCIEHERVHTGERPFECSQCLYRFKAKKHLDKHLRIHNRGGRVPCTYEGCNATFAEKEHVEKHVRSVHLKIKPYKCNYEGCDYASSEASGLKAHKKNKHLPKSERPSGLCSVCGVEVAGGRSNMKIHMIQHSTNFFNCPVCDYKTKYKMYLESHMMRRHGVDQQGQVVEKKLQCPHCPFTCFFNHEFNFHLKKHNPDKPFKCQLCDYQAACASVLKYHMRSHTDHRPYECQHCHKKFGRPSQLAKHKRLHTGEKPHQCNLCGQGFGEKRYLERHILSIHEGLKPFACHICAYTCVKKDTLKNHIRNVHGESALPSDMQTQKKKLVKFYDLPEEEKTKLLDSSPSVIETPLPMVTSRKMSAKVEPDRKGDIAVGAADQDCQFSVFPGPTTQPSAVNSIGNKSDSEPDNRQYQNRAPLRAPASDQMALHYVDAAPGAAHLRQWQAAGQDQSQHLVPCTQAEQCVTVSRNDYGKLPSAALSTEAASYSIHQVIYDTENGFIHL